MRRWVSARGDNPSRRLTWAVLVVCWVSVLHHLMGLWYLIEVPRGLVLARYPVLGLTAVGTLVAGSALLAVWAMLQVAAASEWRRALPRASVVVLLLAVGGNFTYAIVLQRVKTVVEARLRAGLALAEQELREFAGQPHEREYLERRVRDSRRLLGE
jgi:hypothetical protein